MTLSQVILNILMSVVVVAVVVVAAMSVVMIHRLCRLLLGTVLETYLCTMFAVFY
jgi:hypothetical protein